MSKICLSDICEVSAGQSAPQKKEFFSEDGYPFVRAGSLESLIVGNDKLEHIKDNIGKNLRLRLFPKNTILFAKSGMSAKIGRVYKLLQPSYVVSHLATIIPDEEKVNPDWLKRWFEFHPPSRLIPNEAYPSIKLSDILRLSLTVVPLEEQNRISTLIGTADSLRQKRKEQLNLLDDYLKSVFFEMFGDPVRNEKGWNSCKVIDVCDCIVPGRDKPKSFTGSMPWVTTDDLECLGWTLNSKKNVGLTSEEISTVRAKVIPKDSVIMTCVGDLGVVSIAKDEFVMNQQLHAFICSERIKNIFLMFSLFFQKDYMLRMASSTTVPYMNKTICNSVPVLLPPIGLQNKFASIVEQVEQTKQKMRASLDEMDNHFNALMQRYFG